MSDIKSLTIGVIGAHGKTGSMTIKALQNHGFTNIIAFTNHPKTSNNTNTSTTQIKLDLINTNVNKLIDLFTGVDIIIFLAGAGDQGLKHLFAVDIDGVAKCVEAAQCANVERFILTSVINVEERDFWWSMDKDLKYYFIAKRCADHEVRYSSLNWTILQPGWLTINYKPTGKIQPIEDIEQKRIIGYTIEREDLAEVIISCILNPETTSKRTIPLANGNIPINQIISNLK